MRIANPIYDVDFKYLMNDKKVARLIISKIIGEEIESLEIRPSEHVSKVRGDRFTVSRIDFAATILQPDGNKKLVLIEIQKAKFPTDIMRFRQYLGVNYQDKKNTWQDEETLKTKALPIISVYFLGHKLDHIDCPVVQVKRKYIDSSNGQELKQKEDFIESLTHDSFVIQIPLLKKKRRNSLEVLLSIFDQSQQTDNRHFLELNKAKYPKEYQIITRQLLKAAAETEVCEEMDIEDEILNELENLERRINRQSIALVDKDKELEGKDKALEDQNRVLEDQKRALNKAIEALIESGMSRENAGKALGFEQVDKK